MVRLSDREKAQLKEGLGGSNEPAKPSRQDKPPAVTRAQFIKFATFANRFARGRKPVNFGGKHWKL